MDKVDLAYAFLVAVLFVTAWLAVDSLTTGGAPVAHIVRL